jgi:hypothetical protein
LLHAVNSGEHAWHGEGTIGMLHSQKRVWHPCAESVHHPLLKAADDGFVVFG